MMSLQPIAMLPPEIIRKIVLHTVEGPHSHRQIMRLSQVSKLWRDVVLGISALFTEARWSEWPLALVELWCSHAGPRLLKLRVDHVLLVKMGGALAYQELLRKRAVQLGHLEFYCDGWRDPDASALLDLRMPSLHCLSFINALRTENIPMLRALKLDKATPEIPAPLTNTTHLHYANYSRALQRDMAQIFSKLPQLQHLSLKFLDTRDIQTTWPRNVVQSLISLEVTWPLNFSLTPISPLDLSSLPNLQTIVLHGVYGGIESTPFFQSLV
jgi:CheY-like chemotaxis protein